MITLLQANNKFNFVRLYLLIVSYFQTFRRKNIFNTWLVTNLLKAKLLYFSPDDIDRTNEILKYNQDFNLKCVEGDEMICSTPKISTLNSATYCPYKYFKNGEINQSVGLAVKKVKHYKVEINNTDKPHLLLFLPEWTNNVSKTNAFSLEMFKCKSEYQIWNRRRTCTGIFFH